MLERVRDWAAYLSGGDDPTAVEHLRKHSRTGRPVGSQGFLEIAEKINGRSLRP